MPVIRLNDSHRSFLCDLAASSIKCLAEEKADKAAYEKAAPIVRRLVEDRYPAKDMKLLLKYEVASHDSCIRLQLSAGGVVEFNFRGEKTGPLTPGTRSHGCNNRMYAADEVATPIISASLQALDAIKKVRAQKLSDYRSLINASSTLEQIEPIWPAAAALRERVGRSLPVVLSDEVIARIKADATPLKRAA